MSKEETLKRTADAAKKAKSQDKAEQALRQLESYYI